MNQDLNLKGIFDQILAGFVPEAEYEKYRMEFEDLLNLRLMIRLKGMFTEDDDKALQGKSDPEILDYVSAKGINLMDIALEEAMLFRDDMIANLSYAQGIIDSMKKEKE